MKYSLNSHVKVRANNKISNVVHCEKILDTNIYYLKDGSSFAEHQLEVVSSSEIFDDTLGQLSKTYQERSMGAANCLINNLFRPYYKEQEEKRKKFDKREKMFTTILGSTLLLLILFAIFHP